MQLYLADSFIFENDCLQIKWYSNLQVYIKMLQINYKL